MKRLTKISLDLTIVLLMALPAIAKDVPSEVSLLKRVNNGLYKLNPPGWIANRST